MPFVNHKLEMAVYIDTKNVAFLVCDLQSKTYTSQKLLLFFFKMYVTPLLSEMFEISTLKMVSK